MVCGRECNNMAHVPVIVQWVAGKGARDANFMVHSFCVVALLHFKRYECADGTSIQTTLLR